MKILNWIKNRFSKNSTITYWDTPTTPDNVKERFYNLYNAYTSLHSPIDVPEKKEIIKSLKGNFSVSGHNTWSDESKYNGHFSITPTQREHYKTEWNLGFSNQSQSGVGFLFENYFHIRFNYKDEDQQFEGEVIYLFIEAEKAIGFWIEEGIFEVGYEELTFKNSGF